MSKREDRVGIGMTRRKNSKKNITIKEDMLWRIDHLIGMNLKG